MVRAKTSAEIEHEFPELRVVETAPAWLSAQELERIRRQETYDLYEDRAAGLLADIVMRRNSG